MSDLQLFEFANEAFYLAFESKDFSAMENIWCERGQPICLHPGWPALVGREAILNSWENILGNAAQGSVSFFDPVLSQISDESVAVICYEQAGDQVMVATNVFKLEEGMPRLYIHQSGFCPQG